MKTIVWLCLTGVLLAALVLSGCAKASLGDEPSTSGGIQGMDLVAGGVVMSSESYRLVLTTGQGPGGNGVSTSESYRLQGGLVGITE